MRRALDRAFLTVSVILIAKGLMPDWTSDHAMLFIVGTMVAVGVLAVIPTDEDG